MNKRGLRRTLVGLVVSDAMDKTVVVRFFKGEVADKDLRKGVITRQSEEEPAR